MCLLTALALVVVQDPLPLSSLASGEGELLLDAKVEVEEVLESSLFKTDLGGGDGGGGGESASGHQGGCDDRELHVGILGRLSD